MKLNENFIKHNMDGQALVVPTADAPFHGIVQGNRSVEVILDCLGSETTEEEIVSVMCETFDGDREIIRRDVADVIEKLRSIGAIDE